jgi:single-strand DNA-binding protein
MSIDSEPTALIHPTPAEPADLTAENTAVNSVVLTGIIAEPGEARQIAGGVEVVQWTLRVSRGPGRTGSDLIDCIAVDPVLQQQALTWELGAPVTVCGAIRRRFFRTAGRTTTRVEVEVDQVPLASAA